jgi:hypothetical protein
MPKITLMINEVLVAIAAPRIWNLGINNIFKAIFRNRHNQFVTAVYIWTFLAVMMMGQL